MQARLAHFAPDSQCSIVSKSVIDDIKTRPVIMLMVLESLDYLGVKMPDLNVGRYLVTVHEEMHANFGAKMSIQLATTKEKQLKKT